MGSLALWQARCSLTCAAQGGAAWQAALPALLRRPRRRRLPRACHQRVPPAGHSPCQLAAAVAPAAARTSGATQAADSGHGLLRHPLHARQGAGRWHRGSARTALPHLLLLLRRCPALSAATCRCRRRCAAAACGLLHGIPLCPLPRLCVEDRTLVPELGSLREGRAGAIRTWWLISGEGGGGGKGALASTETPPAGAHIVWGNLRKRATLLLTMSATSPSSGFGSPSSRPRLASTVLMLSDGFQAPLGGMLRRSRQIRPSAARGQAGGRQGTGCAIVSKQMRPSVPQRRGKMSQDDDKLRSSRMDSRRSTHVHSYQIVGACTIHACACAWPAPAPPAPAVIARTCCHTRAQAPTWVYVGMVHLGQEADLGRFEGVAGESDGKGRRPRRQCRRGFCAKAPAAAARVRQAGP